MPHFNWRGAAALLTAQAGREVLIVTFPGFGKIPLSHYFKDPQRIEPMSPREFIYDRRPGALPLDPALAALNRAALRSYAARHEVIRVIASLPLTQDSMDGLGDLFRHLRYPGCHGLPRSRCSR
jgi:hypothetical protein